MEPLRGLSVLDLTHGIAGPKCTQLLGNLGAEVIKLEPPGGEQFRDLLEGTAFASCNNGGKRSVCVNLKSELGYDVFTQLVERSDIIVCNYTPRVVDKLAVDFESVQEYNSDIVYCALTGFGQTGPYSDYPAFDPVVQAVSGIMSLIGYEDRPPVRISAPVIDVGAGITAAFAVLADLIRCNNQPDGSFIETSLLDVAVTFLGFRIPEYYESGEVPPRSGAALEGIAPYSVYEAKDGEPFFLGVQNDRLFERLCRALDCEELLEMERYENNTDRWEHRDELRAYLEDIFAEFNRKELTNRLAGAGVPAGPVNDMADVLADAHIQSRGMLSDSYNPYTDGDTLVPTVPYRFDGEDATLEGRPPKVGEHSLEVLGELGFSDAEIEELATAGAIELTAE